MDPEIEIRHLLPSHRRFLSDVLDADDHWKSLAAVLMKPDCSGEHLISSASMILLEREKSNQNGSPTRALLDYWGTFGRKHERPRIKDLLNALKNARLFRAADYVSVNLLNGPSISAVDEDEEDGITDNLSHFEREKVGQTVGSVLFGQFLNFFSINRFPITSQRQLLLISLLFDSLTTI